MLSTALGLPEDMSRRSVVALEVQDFSYGLLSPSSRIVKLGIIVYYGI